MDFADLSVVHLGPRVRAGADEWPAVLRAHYTYLTESVLPPVHSYADAVRLMRATGADRLFVPAEVLAELVTSGVGP